MFTNTVDPYAGLREQPAWPKVLDLRVPDREHRLVVKFRCEDRVRLVNGVLQDLNGQRVRTVMDLELAQIVPIAFRPAVLLDDAVADAIEREAAANTGVRPYDLRSMFVVDAPADRLEEIGEALAALDVVEWAEFEMLRPEPPSCADAFPISADLTSLQTYTSAFDGFNIDNARALYPNSTGAGVKIADVEYGANGDHEDLCNVTFETGQTISQWVFDNGWDAHGTAVLGIMMAGDNGYGVTGIAHDADAYFYPEWTDEEASRRAAAITGAANAVGVGGIVVLEMQTQIYGDNFGPAELNSSVWIATKNAVDAGRIVIGAAGNGDQNLDSAVYAPYRNRGDSGAIIVGAGSAGGPANKLGFSTYGSRVNVQGWGESVATTGYGWLVTYGNDKNQRYMSSFSGTSSATPCVAGVAAIV
ncbi:MAG: S8 family serine peptidase, partial [Planctomycetota bacterium]